jgi:hypothetical protein
MRLDWCLPNEMLGLKTGYKKEKGLILLTFYKYALFIPGDES